jgi:hypothetical protein
MKNRLYFARRASVPARRMGVETVVMSAADSSLLTLNEIASLIWEAADGLTALDQVVAATICPSFDVEPERALLDAEAVVRDLAAQGVLEVSDQPIPSHDLR